MVAAPSGYAKPDLPRGPRGIALRRGGVDATKRRAPAAQLFFRLVVALAAVLAFVIHTSAERASANLQATAFLAMAHESASSDGMHRWHDDAEPLATDVDAIEWDDDEDDPEGDALDGARPVLDGAPSPRGQRCEPSGEPPRDTSRFAAVAGLPRGPPA